MFHTLVRPFEKTTAAVAPQPKRRCRNRDIDDLTYRRSLNLPSTFSLLLLRVPGG